ncbi:MAG: trigger factor [Nitriliruptor sp.]|nr:MAG: trigger factor [Nitriliruptor sp.]
MPRCRRTGEQVPRSRRPTEPANGCGHPARCPSRNRPTTVTLAAGPRGHPVSPDTRQATLPTPSHDEEPPIVKTSIETIDPVQVKLTVEVEPKRVKQAFDRAARELAKQVDIPGFRKGKVPRRLLEQRFGAGVIAQTAMEDALSSYYAEAVEAEDLQPIAQPEVDVETFDETEGCVFTATVEVRPDFDPPDHTGIGVSFPEWDVDDDEVDQQLASMRDRFAEVDEVERPAKVGDLVTLDLEVEVDGAKLEDATVEDALYEVGSEGVTPQLDEEVVGKEAGDTFTYEDALPEEYPEHGGEEATFHVTVKDVREKTLPALDDDFATSASEFDTIAELRADLKRSLTRRKVEQAQHELRGRILEAYLARIDVSLPPAMVEQEAANRLHEVEHQAERFGMSVEDLLAAQGLSAEEHAEQARTQATGSVKAQLVLDALATKIEPDLAPADIDREIVRHAQANGVAPDEIARIIQEQGTLPALIGDIVRRKTIDAIVAEADIEGGPSDEELIELGLLEDPASAEEAAASDSEGIAADDTDSASDDARLIIPGQDDDTGGDDAPELYVPGRD